MQFQEKIVEVPTVEVREVIKQVSKPEALAANWVNTRGELSNCWQLLLESFAWILHTFFLRLLKVGVATMNQVLIPC